MQAIDLKDRVAVVTGATRGIGREIALVLAGCGAAVGLNHLPGAEESALAGDVIREIEAAGGKAEGLPFDVAAFGVAQKCVSDYATERGRLDIVVTNAGVSGRRHLVEMTEAEWDRVLSVNLKGTFNVIRAALPFMLKRGHGKIVTIASELGLVGRAESAHYCASKAGVIALTKSLAKEVGPLGINVNCIAPGPTVTDMLRRSPEFTDEVKDGIPLRRWGQPRDIAAAVLFLVSDESSYFAGQVLSPNGGFVM